MGDEAAEGGARGELVVRGLGVKGPCLVCLALAEEGEERGVGGRGGGVVVGSGAREEMAVAVAGGEEGEWGCGCHGEVMSSMEEKGEEEVDKEEESLGGDEMCYVDLKQS